MFDPRHSAPMAEVVSAEVGFLLGSANFPDGVVCFLEHSQLVSDPPYSTADGISSLPKSQKRSCELLHCPFPAVSLSLESWLGSQVQVLPLASHGSLDKSLNLCIQVF